RGSANRNSRSFVTRKCWMVSRVAIVGNCQTRGVAEAMSKMLKGCQIEHFVVASFGSLAARERLFKGLGQFDVVFAQPFRKSNLGPLLFDHMRSSLPHLIGFPPIAFGGFHPDFFAAGGDGVKSAAGGYHSRIAVAAYLSGYAAEDVPKLFNAFNFARLG